MEPDDRAEILQDAIDLLTQAAELVEGLHDRFLDAYVLPQLRGQDGGWLGEHAVDHLRNALHATRKPAMSEAATYLRVASNDRGQLDTQTQRLHAYAAEHDMAVTATYSDVGSGTDPDRPGLAAMLTAARAGQFNHLLIDRLDRLARNIADLAAIFDDLDHAGITLHCAAEPSGIITITHDALAIIRLPAAATLEETPPDADHANRATPADSSDQEHRQ